MVTVARSFDAPIKLLFLRAQATADTDAQFSMLGLGDIVIPGESGPPKGAGLHLARVSAYVLRRRAPRGRPGIFIALLLRFDRSQAAARLGVKELPWTADFSKPYFNLSMIGYVLGLGATLFVMYTWQAAQVRVCWCSCCGAPRSPS